MPKHCIRCDAPGYAEYCAACQSVAQTPDPAYQEYIERRKRTNQSAPDPMKSLEAYDAYMEQESKSTQDTIQFYWDHQHQAINAVYDALEAREAEAERLDKLRRSFGS